MKKLVPVLMCLLIAPMSGYVSADDGDDESSPVAYVNIYDNSFGGLTALYISNTISNSPADSQTMSAYGVKTSPTSFSAWGTTAKGRTLSCSLSAAETLDGVSAASVVTQMIGQWKKFNTLVKTQRSGIVTYVNSKGQCNTSVASGGVPL